MTRGPRLVAALATLLLLAACGDDQQKIEYQTYTARVGDLRISISQKGTIEARDPLSVVNPIEGTSLLLDIAPEGSFVKKGDQLFTLDVSDQQDRILQQQISTSGAEQALFSAKQQLEITKQQNESDIKQAELDVLFAELDLEQYVEGDLPREKEGVNAEITIAREQRERAKETLTWSEQLAEKGFISQDKLKGDRFSVKRFEIEEDLALRKLEVLDNYTSKKRKRELESKLEESKRELVRVNARCEAALSQKQVEVESRSAQFDLEKKKLERLQEQIANNIVYAPRDGVVIYAREGGRRDSRPIEEGANVRKGQIICELPDMEQVLVDVDVHESSVHMVSIGLPVLVKTDTGETIQGAIESVATIADSQSWYRNPDLKVYSTKVTIPNPGNRLKPGMNCYAEIIVDNLVNVISIPVYTVFDNGQQTYCYVEKDGAIELREIAVGLHNNERIEVKSGLAEGEKVLLAVPADAPPVPKMKVGEEAPATVVKPDAATGTGKPAAVPGPGSAAGSGRSSDAPGRPAENGAGQAGPRRTGGEGAPGAEGNARRGNRGPMTEEQRQRMEEMRKKFEGMSPEERQKAMEEFRKRRSEGQND
ncbi:MAG: efflux RND transporter periplasmic adaptor subunit [Planctomycetes bacterium]|nr:efflux RND transporter periplasmic adaptor subunit [Planctomycetota bacterium]